MKRELEKQRQKEWEQQRIAEMQAQKEREQEKVLKQKAHNQTLNVELSTLNEKVCENFAVVLFFVCKCFVLDRLKISRRRYVIQGQALQMSNQ